MRGKPADIGPESAIVDTYVTPVEKDPFAVPLDEKIALLLSATEAMTKAPTLVMAEASSYLQRDENPSRRTEGSGTEQTLIEPGCRIAATAGGRRSFRSVARLSMVIMSVCGVLDLRDRKAGGYAVETIDGA